MGTEKQHTPGPWALEEHDDGSFSVVPAVGFGIARVDYMAGQPASANGRLIAAAPELLEACELALCEMNLAISLTKPHTRERKSFEAMKAALWSAIERAAGRLAP